MDTDPAAAPAPVTLDESFKYWLKLGFISFGGPAGQISMMHQELVEKWRVGCTECTLRTIRNIPRRVRHAHQLASEQTMVRMAHPTQNISPTQPPSETGRVI